MNVKDTVPRNHHYRCLEYDHDQKGDICLIACGMERCDPGVTFGPEVRDCWHLHIILSGKGTLKVNGQEFHPRFGQMFILKDNELVEYSASRSDPWSYCWVTYNGTEARRISEEIGFTEGVYCLDSSVDAKDFYELVVRMHEKPEMNYINDLRRRGILLELLALAMEATEINGRRPERRYEYSPEVYVQRAVNFINQNYATIRVSDVMTYIGFTRSYFTTLFRKHVGVSPQQYLLQCRLKKSCEQLEATDKPIQDIALQVGYDDPLAFSRLFKKSYGISPTEYRNKTTKKENAYE